MFNEMCITHVEDLFNHIVLDKNDLEFNMDIFLAILISNQNCKKNVKCIT